MRALRLALLLLALAAPARAQPRAEVFDVPSARPGAVVPVALATPDQPWSITALLLVGSGGLAGVHQHGPTGRGSNTLYRGMDILVRHGLAAAVMDTPSDWPSLWNERDGAAHAADISRVIAVLRQRGARAVWLVGISMGTLSAANAAARLGPGEVAGIVLMSSIVKRSRESAETVLQVPLERIAVPVLLVRSQDDTCPSSVPTGAERIATRLTAAPVKRMLTVSGPAGNAADACGPYAAHGYVGIEEQVLGEVADWIKSPG